jgi:hypothetical protein
MIMLHLICFMVASRLTTPCRLKANAVMAQAPKPMQMSYCRVNESIIRLKGTREGPGRAKVPNWPFMVMAANVKAQ